MDRSAPLNAAAAAANVDSATPASRTTGRDPPAAAAANSSAASSSRDATGRARPGPSSVSASASPSSPTTRPRLRRAQASDFFDLGFTPPPRDSKRAASPSPPPRDTGAAADSGIASQLESDEAFARSLALATARHETRSRVPMTMSASPEPSSPPPATPILAAPPKKRPPKNASKAKTDAPPRKPPAKKRKADDASERSATPASVAGAKKKAGGKKSLSATPMTGATPEPKQDANDDAADDDESVEDEDAVYCICRKPDNHTWMIGCDGGCDDWYHGKCVNMRQEDEQLIDKFICPICADRTDAVTTWKPMCRREGCRNPARLKKGSESKYCSDQCGERFWAEKVQQAQQVSRDNSRRKLPSKKSAKLESLEEHDADIGPLGGPITASELKALVNAAPDANTFRNMGEIGLPTPPDSADVEEQQHGKDEVAPIYEPYEEGRLAEIVAIKARLYEQRVVLRKRERFVMMTRDRATRIRQTNKDACGFDPLLAADATVFTAWIESADGQAALEAGTLADPAPKRDDDEDAGEADAKAICLRRRCKKHGEWQKIALQDVRFDEAEVGDSMREIDAEETDLKRAGAMRGRARHEGAMEHDGGTVEHLDEEMTDV